MTNNKIIFSFINPLDNIDVQNITEIHINKHSIFVYYFDGAERCRKCVNFNYISEQVQTLSKHLKHVKIIKNEASN